jgi:hypothetical protein
LFHNVLLLGKGGHVIYLGSTEDILPYFENLGFSCPVDINPADYILDVMSGSVPRKGYDNFDPQTLPDLWEEHTSKHSGVMSTGQQVSQNLKAEVGKRSPWMISQLWLCFRRAIYQQLREPNRIIFELFLVMAAALSLGLTLGLDFQGPLPDHIVNICPVTVGGRSFRSKFCDNPIMNRVGVSISNIIL